MKTWQILPEGNLCFRDGRPNEGRSQSRSLPFPYPQTLAGALRSYIGTGPDGRFTLTAEEALKIQVAAPLLARQPLRGCAAPILLLPAPGDALWHEDPETKAYSLLRLGPLEETVHRWGDVPDEESKLLPVGLTQERHRDGKPPAKVPLFWTWKHLRGWLLGHELRAERVMAAGQRGLEQEVRTHTAIDSTTGRAAEGALFSEASLCFVAPGASRISRSRQLSLVAAVEDGRMQEGVGTVGGKGQLARFRQGGILWPGCPGALREYVGKNGKDSVRIRLQLATPGIFTEGWRPDLSRLAGKAEVTLTLVAAKVDRPLTLSGYDLATRRPKASRRAVAAGAVYWLDLEGPPEARLTWMDECWMRSISDLPQDRLDGFGLALLGVG